MTESLKNRVKDALHFAEVQARRLVGTHAPPWPIYTERGKWRAGAEGDWASAAAPVIRLVRALADCPAADDLEFWQGRADAFAASRGESGRAGQELAQHFQPNGQYLA